MNDIVFIDTCIIIDFFKKNKKVIENLNNISKPVINSVVEMEIIQGARNKHELYKIENEIANFYRINLNQKILDKATQLVKSYSLSHNLFLPDAVIAANCTQYDISLYTYNKKDFKYIKKINFY